MPVEVINLLSSPELPQPVESRVKAPNTTTTAPVRSHPHMKALTYEPPKNDWFTLSSDDNVALPKLPPPKPKSTFTKPKSNVITAPKPPNDDWFTLSSEHELELTTSKPKSAFAKPALKVGATTEPGASTKTSKGSNDFFFLSDDFESTINHDETLGLGMPHTKRRRVSSSPKTTPVKTIVRKAGVYKRSFSNIESSTRATAVRTASAPILKRASTSGKPLDLDPLIFTSSPDPFADIARRRKEKRMNTWEENNGEDIFDLEPRQKNTASGISKSNQGSELSGISFDDSSDLDLSGIGAIPPTKVTTKTSSRGPQSVLAKYDAQKAAEKKAKEKEQKTKEKAATQELEKEKKRLAKEGKIRERENAAEIAKVNTLRTDKKVSTPEMIVDLPSSLNKKVADQARTFLAPLQVELTEWESSLPLVKWRRKVEARYNEEMGHWEPMALHIKAEKHIMYVISALDFVNLATGEEGQDLDAHVLRLKAKFHTCDIIYLIEGYKAWMRKNVNVKNRQFTQAVRNQMNQEEPTATQRRKKKEAEYVEEDLIEDALLRLQVMHGILIHHTHAPIETAEWIVTFTQHISTIPYRNKKQTLDTAFCMESGQVKTGHGPEDTFVKMLQEILRITASIAYGIAAEYPTVQKLVKGLEEKGPLALEDFKKCANKDGAFTDRRIGPSISKRVYKVFTGRDPSSLDV